MRERIVTLLIALAAVAALPGAARAKGVHRAEVRGYGVTPADARQDALARAAEWVGGLLREREPHLVVFPDGKKLQEQKLVVVSPATEHESRILDEAFRASAEVTVSGSQLEGLIESQLGLQRKLVKEQRREEMYARHLVALKVLCGLVLLLGSLAVYFHLEDATRGYYGGVLKTGLLVALAVIGAGLWFLV